jgi:hypothetical protein
MDTSTEGYLGFVVLGVSLVIVIGQLLIRSGKVYLEEVFPEERTARSVSRLLAVLFYLFALGVLGVISTMEVPVEGATQTVVTKLGVVMLILGIVFGATMFVLSRIRTGREEEAMISEMHNTAGPPPIERETRPMGPAEPGTAHTDARLMGPA